jgi:hypothetical protein
LHEAGGGEGKLTLRAELGYLKSEAGELAERAGGAASRVRGFAAEFAEGYGSYRPGGMFLGSGG